MALEHGAAGIKSDGLVFYIDAANTKSYPGSGLDWKDLTNNHKDCTLSNGSTFSSSKGGAIVLDGTDDLVNVSSDIADFNSDFTLSAWVNPDTLPLSDTAYTLVSNKDTTSAFQFRIDGDAGAGSTPAWHVVDSWQVAVGVFDNFPPVANSWSNVTVTRSSDTYSLYIDGVYKSNFTNSETYANGTKTIGVNYNNTEEWDGKISTIMVYDRTLTAEEILHNYNALKGRFL